MNDAAIVARQVALLYRNIGFGQAISVINAALLAWLWHDRVGLEAAALWWAAVVIVAGSRTVVAQKYRWADSVRRDADRFWLRAALAGAALGGAVWAAGALLFMRGGDTVQLIFTAFVMAGMVAGAVPILAPHRLAFRLYAWPISLAVMAAGAGSDFLHLSFELMAVLFVLGSSRSADNFHDTLHETLRLEQEKDRLVSDLEQARRRAESSDRAKSEFLANISHELRTPMNGIMGMADLLAMGELGPGQQELLQPLRQSADELLQKIENMIELSALEVGELLPRPVPFNLPELVDTLLAKHRAAAAAKGLAFSARHDAGLPPVVVGDADLVGKILHHLVDNAIKFTAAGGVDIATVLVARAGHGIEVAFVVRDTGPGIPADRLESLFGLFTQGDGSSTRRHGGTGIGLAIARRLAETLGGSLTVDSRPGGGTTIRIALPFRLPRS